MERKGRRDGLGSSDAVGWIEVRIMGMMVQQSKPRRCWIVGMRT